MSPNFNHPTTDPYLTSIYSNETPINYATEPDTDSFDNLDSE